ncbi:MAG TPA: GH32 C-terminal domain-containing protein, partial [Luteitalea sp.]|nr:GH32 C-terminal domain-containing protein [Luteitalea sp.]
RERTPLPQTADVSFVVTAQDSTDTGLRLSNDAGEEVLIAVSGDRRELSIDRRNSRLGASPPGYAERHVAPLRASAQVPVRVVFDRTIVEVFALDGEVVMTERLWPTMPFSHVEWIGGRRPASGATRLMSLRPAVRPR